jgi:hypothetical protein
MAVRLSALCAGRLLPLGRFVVLDSRRKPAPVPLCPPQIPYDWPRIKPETSLWEAVDWQPELWHVIYVYLVGHARFNITWQTAEPIWRVLKSTKKKKTVQSVSYNIRTTRIVWLSNLNIKIWIWNTLLQELYENISSSEEFYLLWYNAVSSVGNQPTFRTNMSPQSSG